VRIGCGRCAKFAEICRSLHGHSTDTGALLSPISSNLFMLKIFYKYPIINPVEGKYHFSEEILCQKEVLFGMGLKTYQMTYYGNQLSILENRRFMIYFLKISLRKGKRIVKRMRGKETIDRRSIN
jgi:hypothetical protein